MAEPFVISRVVALPQVLETNTMYIVKQPGSAEVQLTFVGTTADAIGHTLTHSSVETMISAALAGVASVYVVANIAAMNALTPQANSVCYVKNTTGDPLATGGAGAYVWSTVDALWLPLPGTLKKEITWNEITGKPTSSPAQIDQAVLERHTHANMATLDLLSDDGGKLAYRGEPVSDVDFESNW